MTNALREAVKLFKEENGNKNISNKDLIMYAITRIDNLRDEIEEKLTNLPCQSHVDVIYNNKNEITKLRTTNKVLAAVFGTSILIIGIIITIIQVVK